MSLVGEVFKKPSVGVTNDIIDHLGLSTDDDIFIVLKQLQEDPYNKWAKRYLLYDKVYRKKIAEALKYSYHPDILKYLKPYIRREHNKDGLFIQTHLFEDKSAMNSFFSPDKSVFMREKSIADIWNKNKNKNIVMGVSYISMDPCDYKLYMGFSVVYLSQNPHWSAPILRYEKPKIANVYREDKNTISKYMKEISPDKNYFEIFKLDPKKIPIE